MKLPIVVIGTGPRCGSTPYVELLSQQLNLPAFSEPWCEHICSNDSSYLRSYNQYIEHKKHSNRYIVKFWLADLEQRSPYQSYIKNGYKILLMRRDIVSQIASLYIAEYRDKYHTLKEDQDLSYTVAIEPKDISISIRYLTRSLFFAEHCNIFDARIYYEDIDFSSLKSPYKKTIQPSNLAELKQEIEKQLKDTIPAHWLVYKKRNVL
jgi:hypothetical protein